MPKRSSPERSPRAPDAREDIRRAVSCLYGRARSDDALTADWRRGKAPWRLLTEFTVDGARFVVVWRSDCDVAVKLTPREREVVALAGSGESNKSISYRLGITASTVGVLLWRAASKLGVTSRADLIRAMRQREAVELCDRVAST